MWAVITKTKQTRIRLCEVEIYYDVIKCLQVKRGKCSLHVALYHALFNNNHEFVYSFIDKVDMKKFLDRDCLDHLYDKVSRIALVYNLCTNIQYSTCRLH